MIEKAEVTVQRTVLAKVNGTIGDLCKEFRAMVPKQCHHVMVINQQNQAYRQIKDVKQNIATVVIDFSENFTCERLKSIQSPYFGASNRQITLHTGVAYTSSGKTSFCTVSDDTRHDAPAIWAHLEPVVKHLVLNKGINGIHIWSDGPTTQYRNKVNFLLLAESKNSHRPSPLRPGTIFKQAMAKARPMPSVGW